MPSTPLPPESLPESSLVSGRRTRQQGIDVTCDLGAASVIFTANVTPIGDASLLDSE
jgi:hypothetical protein